MRPLGGAGRCRRLGLLRWCWVSDPAPFLALRLGNRRPLGGRSSLRGFLPSYRGGEAPSAPTWSTSKGPRWPAASSPRLLAEGPARGTLPAVSSQTQGQRHHGLVAPGCLQLVPFLPARRGGRGTAGPLDFSLALLFVCARRVTSVVPDSVILGCCPNFDLILSN